MPANPPLAILAPPDAVPSAPPVSTRAQLLPFDALSWENFERLCHRLTAFDGDVEHCVRYGRQGDAQEGIDIFARQGDGRYHCLQAKRHRTFGATKLRDAVNLFLAGSWATRAARFTIAVQASLRSTAVQEEIERQTELLASRGIAFEALDGEGLTDHLRSQPVLVDDFFGRPWVVALVGQQIADSLGERLDGAAFARVRAQLARVYEAQFQFVDPGSFVSVGDEDGRPALNLLERFCEPDILVRETPPMIERGDSARIEAEQSGSGTSDSLVIAEPEGAKPSDTVINSHMRRLPLTEWFGGGQRLVLLGDAGCGKSTLLRVVALDLLHEQTHFPGLAKRWGQHIPLYIPFARWSSHVARDGNPIGIKEIVRRSLEQLLTSSIVELLNRAIDDQRVLLLVDGLDEWSTEQAARATLSALVTTVEAHSIPVIVSGRPRALSRIGALPANWRRGTVAPLTPAQQASIAGRWFGRFAAAASDGSGLSAARLRTDRFMAELARDANLSVLAAVPLLLIGLVTLALRGQILPRTRGDIYDQLVRVLLEVHPDRRATASGDTESRFRYAVDPQQRRAAIARLALAMRERTGGASMPTATARDILRIYLASPQGFELTNANAAAAAGEILSVNAETQGLIVEKAPGEVGFVHASFEEFLGAEHLSGWPFSEIEAFVRTHAGDGRWRHVITNLLGRIQRRDEFDRLVAIIEEPAPDELARFHRQVLLGDIAFGAATRAPATARRLALATIGQVETEDWLPARREALASVLGGLPDPMFKADIEQRLRCWLPARPSYVRASVISAFGAWQPTAQLQDVLFRAMHDEDNGVQRAAAAAYAKSFSPSTDACQRLLDGLGRTRDLATAASLLESLALGWPTVPEAEALFDEAWRSHGAELRLVGILGLAETGRVGDEARDVVLRAQSFWSNISSPHRELAAAMLMKYWPGDETLVNSALRRLSGQDFDSPWEYESAVAYLMESPVNHATVRAWILAEFGRDFPFNAHRNDRIWLQIGRFAAADPDIRAAANTYWCDPQNRLLGMHNIPAYVAQAADQPVAAMLVGVLSERKSRFDRHWALSALLAGWGRNNSEVKPVIDALADSPDEDLDDLVALLPEIVPDKAVARERLIRMSARAEVRRDLLAIGLEGCGCGAADNDAVEAILAFPEQLRGPFDASYPLIRAFGAHASVRSFALERCCERDAPLRAIATGYANDSEFAHALFDAACPLPVDLRAQVVEVAADGGAGTMLNAILGQAMLETDSELRARMVMARCRALPPEAHDTTLQALLAQAVAVGSYFDSDRAVALAGLATIGELDKLSTLEDRGKLVALVTDDLYKPVAAIQRLVCERFAEFEAAFGDSLLERFNSFGGRSNLPRVLSAAPSASTAARTAFLALAELGELPRSPQALRALAAERPHSGLLLARCWDMLESREHGNDRAMVNAEVGLILREHFPGDPCVRRRLVELFRDTPGAATAIALAIFEPEAEELPFPIEVELLGREFADWAVAVHLVARRADSTAFCRLLEAMVTRQWRSQFDAQQIANLAVTERLQRDAELERLLSERIGNDVNPSISGSFARYLAAAGKLSPDARGRVLELLQVLGTNQRLPVAGYDAISDQWRTVRVTLLDAVSAGLELG